MNWIDGEATIARQQCSCATGWRKKLNRLGSNNFDCVAMATGGTLEAVKYCAMIVLWAPPVGVEKTMSFPSSVRPIPFCLSVECRLAWVKSLVLAISHMGTKRANGWWFPFWPVHEEGTCLNSKSNTALEIGRYTSVFMHHCGNKLLHFLLL